MPGSNPNAALIAALTPPKPIPYDPEVMQALADADRLAWQRFNSLRAAVYRRIMPDEWREIFAAERRGDAEAARQLQCAADRRWEAAMGVPPLTSFENLAIVMAIVSASYPATDAGLHAWVIAQRATPAGADSHSPRIPSEFRTRAMSKAKAAAYLRGGNVDSGVEWLNNCIADGTIYCETLSRQSHVFDVRQFPAKVQSQIRPD